MRRFTKIIALGGALACAATSSAVHAQADDEVPVILAVGTYEGSLNFTGGFILDFAEGLAESGQNTGEARVTGAINVDAAINGPATMIVAESGVSGEWSVAGTGGADGTITGTVDGITVAIDISATSVYDAAGTFEGEPDNARLVGTFNGTTTATVTAPFGSQSATDTSSEPLTITLTNPIGDCGRAFARVDLEITQRIEQVPGATATVTGVFSGADPTADQLVFTESEILADKISALWNRLQSQDELMLELMADAYELLRDVEAFEDRLDPDSCGNDPDFANVMTLLSADLIDVILSRVASGEGDLDDRQFFIEQALELGLRTGALGKGTKIRSRAMQIAANAESALSGVFQEASDAGDLRVLENSALLARQYGWELVNSAGVTSEDVLVTLGVE